MLVALIFASVLLAVGLMARAGWTWLSRARVPASLVGGLIGLIVVQLMSAFHTTPVWLHDALVRMRDWPGILIAVVFAGMLLGRRTPNPGSSSRWSAVGRQGLMVWIIVLGQSAVGMLVTWCLIQPWYDLPNSTGLLIETGFAGGHGTAAAMGAVLAQPTVGLPEGLDLGILMATGGLVYGLIGGMFWVNLGTRWGWFPASVSASEADSPDDSNRSDGLALDARETENDSLPTDAIDPLLLQLIWLMIAMGIAMAMQSTVAFLGSWLDVVTFSGVDESLRSRASVSGVVSSFPLFIYTLMSGGLVRWTLGRFGKPHWVDSELIQRWIGTSMDLLVIAAVVTLNLEAVASLWVPLAVLFIAGTTWSTFCWLVLSRRILPRSSWFPLSVINFGMSTGTTATGFVLLRAVDPELKSGAAEDYALAAPLSAPFIGGGMLTIGLPLLVLEGIPIAASSLLLWLVVIGLVLFGFRLARD
ncbi:MAG: sodium/glutamate symporter [Planctomycetota bacterium]